MQNLFLFTRYCLDNDISVINGANEGRTGKICQGILKVEVNLPARRKLRSSCWNCRTRQCSKGKERPGQNCVRLDVIRHLILQKIKESQHN